MAEARNAVAYTTLDPDRARQRSASLTRTDQSAFALSEQLIRASIYGKSLATGRSPGGLALATLQHAGQYIGKKWEHAQKTLRNGLFPGTSKSWLLSLGAVVAARNLDSLSWITTAIDENLPGLSLLPEGTGRDIVAVVVSATGIWLVGTFSSRQCLKGLLMYKGYLYDPPKRPRMRTVVWSMLIRLALGYGKPNTYSYQSVLPRLPVPSLRMTCQRYLQSVRPLLDDAEYDRMCRLAAAFESQEGPALQRLLWLKSLWASNYVTDWWERFVYLRGREAIMINSNFYVIDSYEYIPTPHQASRAAMMTFQILRFKTLVDTEELQPISGGGGTVPLCMSQYRRIFGTTRIPGLEEDSLQHITDSAHIAVLCDGAWYILNTIDQRGRPLQSRDFEKQFEWILDDRSRITVDENAAMIPAMTAGSRTVWAQFRAEHMSEGVTRASLEAVERALFVVVLDSDTPTHSPSHEIPDMVAASLIHGSGKNRWFDKSFNFVVFANGKSGLNVEHSWADAPVMGHLWEWALAEEFRTGYDVNSRRIKAVPQPKLELKRPLRLRFEISEAGVETLQDVIQDVNELIGDLDLVLLKHDQYGKGFIKTCKMSPDAYIQAALQLAYFRDTGHLAQTYEASMTRLFRDGRTETVRPVTMEIAAFVEAMVTPGVPASECIKLLRAAGQKHTSLYRAAMCGEGVDRHLFALYVASVWRETPSEFLREVLNVKWALSTSQTPYNQSRSWDIQGNLDKISAGGGFGPVSDDGYGVSYIIGGDALVSFHVASKRSSTKTSSPKFASLITKSLGDMKKLFESK